jgi:hypothetical protein
VLRWVLVQHGVACHGLQHGRGALTWVRVGVRAKVRVRVRVRVGVRVRVRVLTHQRQRGQRAHQRS